MTKPIVRLLFACLMLGIIGGTTALAEECTGTITPEEALKAEDARYKAQTTNDFAAMEKMFGNDLVYFHSSAAADNKESYIKSMQSGATKYKVMKRTEEKVRTYGCVAIITGVVNVEATSGGQELKLVLRFHSEWVKRPQGLQFVSWQATRVPEKK